MLLIWHLARFQAKRANHSGSIQHAAVRSLCWAFSQQAALAGLHLLSSLTWTGVRISPAKTIKRENIGDTMIDFFVWLTCTSRVAVHRKEARRVALTHPDLMGSRWGTRLRKASVERAKFGTKNTGLDFTIDSGHVWRTCCVFTHAKAQRPVVSLAFLPVVGSQNYECSS